MSACGSRTCNFDAAFQLDWLGVCPGCQGIGCASERFLVRLSLTFLLGQPNQSCVREPSVAQAAIGRPGEDLANFN